MFNGTDPPIVFIATLGNHPQVVTLGLDKLIERHSFVEVCVIHTAVSDQVQSSGIPKEIIQKLDREFLHPKPLEAPPGEKAWRVDYKDTNGRFHQFVYRRVLIRREIQKPGQLASHAPVHDVETPENTDAAFRTIFRTVKGYKSQRAKLHFNISGGRKIMSVFAMASAQLLFTPGDKLWHVASPQKFMQTNAMHDLSEETRLVPIPFISVSTINPVLGMLFSSDDPYDIVQAQENYLHLMDLQRKDRFLRTLDFDEYQILVGVAQGLSNEEIGNRLNKKLASKTVANKLTTIYETYMVSISEVPTDVTRPNYENLRVFLAAEFAAYFQQRGERL